MVYISTDGMQFINGKKSSEFRRQDFARGLKYLCKRAGVKYRSPHSFRHGHGIYGVKSARTVEELKAISQNMMHSTLTTTDSMYGNLGGKDVHRVITTLKQMKISDADISEDALRIYLVLKALLENPHLVDKILSLTMSD